MNLSLRPALAALLAATLLVLCACTTGGDGSDWHASGADKARRGRLNQDQRLPIREYGIAYATDDPAVPIDTGGAEPGPAGRHAALVGLYGELVAQPAPTGRVFDGAGNLVQITAATEGASFDPDVDPSGRLLAFASTQHHRAADVYIKSTSGRTMTQITADPGDDVMPAFAPDSRRIAFASNRQGNWDIYVTTVDGGPPVQFTSGYDDELHPTWSPDGTKLAYCKLGRQSGRWEIWVGDLERSAGPQFLVYGLFPHWNPDPARSKIVFQRARERGSRLFGIWTIDIVSGEVLHPTEIVSAANAAAMHPTWSPDGSRIAFVTVIRPDAQPEDRPAMSDLWAINVDGTGRTNLTNGRFLNLYPTWASDGTIYFLSDRSSVDNIWAVTAGRTLDRATPAARGLVSVDPDLEAPDGRPDGGPRPLPPRTSGARRQRQDAMTSAQTMQPGRDRRSSRGLAAACLAGALLATSGCGPRLTDPEVLSAPHERSQLWGVAPFANESGVSVVDTAAAADAFMEQAQQVNGIDAVPVNRVIAAMRAVDMGQVASPADAMTLMNVLDLDGLIVGTITAYDPYRPMTLGMAVQLYFRPERDAFGGLDPRVLTRSTSDDVAAGELGPPHPVAQAAGVFDAANHQTLQWLEAYAAGRTEPDSAYGRDIYLVRMDLYTKFVSYRLMRDLLAQERDRVTPVAVETE